MNKTPAHRKAHSRTRRDGRRALLVYLDPDIIKKLKKAALDEERNVYEVTEDAAREWLASRRVSRERSLRND